MQAVFYFTFKIGDIWIHKNMDDWGFNGGVYGWFMLESYGVYLLK